MGFSLAGYYWSVPTELGLSGSWSLPFGKSIFWLGPVNLAMLFSFFHFIRRFWNQILICLSVSPSECAISMRLRLVRYLL